MMKLPADFDVYIQPVALRRCRTPKQVIASGNGNRDPQRVQLMTVPFQLYEIAAQLDAWVKDRFGRGGCFFYPLKNNINLYADRRESVIGISEWQIDLYIDAAHVQGLPFDQAVELVETEIAIHNVCGEWP